MGVDKKASLDEIKSAYRKLARKYHPDVSKEPNAEERFKEIGEAYAVLSDSEKRKAYDQLGHRWRAGDEFTPPPGWQHNGRSHANFSDIDLGDFSDFFASIFGGRGQSASPFGAQSQRYSTKQQRGQDIQTKLPISLEEAYKGGTQTVTLPSLNKTLKVKIPAGISEGQQIRLTGQGQLGKHGAPAGDLFIQIQFIPHPYFRVDNKDIMLNLPITPWEAALGTTISIPTLGGKVEIKIPANSQSGKKFRLKGRGLGGKSPGDQYVILQMVTPSANSTQEKEFYTNMAKQFSFNPRTEY